MRLYITVCFVILAIFIGACTKTPDAPAVPSPMTAEYLLEHTYISRNDKLGLTKLQSLPYRQPIYDKESNETITSILVADIYDRESRGTKKYANGISCYLWVVYSADKWGEFDTALPLLGNPLKVSVHSSRIRKGVFFQEISIDLSLKTMRQSRDTGLSFIVMGKSSTIALDVPPLYVQTFLDSLDKIVQKETSKK